MIKKTVYIIIAIILISAICVGGYFLLKDKGVISTAASTSSIRNEKITSENYKEISDKVSKELGDTDDAYYFSYICMYYVMKDGFTKEYMETQDDNLLYKNIYGKTLQDLINEGKKLMKDNGISLEEYKKQLVEFNNTINQ